MLLFTYSRLDPVRRESPLQLSDATHLHSEVSPADHGLPGKALFFQTTGDYFSGLTAEGKPASRGNVFGIHSWGYSALFYLFFYQYCKMWM